MTLSFTWLQADYSQAEARIVARRGVPSLDDWFSQGKDIHTEVMRLIARTVQEQRITMPKNMFAHKSWREYGKDDVEERTIAKQTVHANNYGMGVQKYSLITGLPESYAKIMQDIYFGLFPEIKSGYQASIEEELRSTGVIRLPKPFAWSRAFYDFHGPDLFRAAYAFYPQSTVGLLLTQTFCRVREYWAGEKLWKDFRVHPIGRLVTPTFIKGLGLDIKLQVHDSINISVPNNPEAIAFAAKVTKRLGEVPIEINSTQLVIPMDFKTGPSWGDLEDFHPAEAA